MTQLADALLAAENKKLRLDVERLRAERDKVVAELIDVYVALDLGGAENAQPPAIVINELRDELHEACGLIEIARPALTGLLAISINFDGGEFEDGEVPAVDAARAALAAIDAAMKPKPEIKQ